MVQYKNLNILAVKYITIFINVLTMADSYSMVKGGKLKLKGSKHKRFEKKKMRSS